MATKKKPRGRPPKIAWPEPIDASPEDIARAVLQVPHKKEWRFMKEAKCSPNSRLRTQNNYRSGASSAIECCLACRFGVRRRAYADGSAASRMGQIWPTIGRG